MRRFIGSEAGDKCLERSSEGVLRRSMVEILREPCATGVRPNSETHEVAVVLPRGTTGHVDRHAGADMSSMEYERARVRSSNHEQELAGDSLHIMFHNDSTARAYVRAHCPFAAEAYDCLRPPSYKADLWCVCTRASC